MVQGGLCLSRASWTMLPVERVTEGSVPLVCCRRFHLADRELGPGGPDGSLTRTVTPGRAAGPSSARTAPGPLGLTVRLGGFAVPWRPLWT